MGYPGEIASTGHSSIQDPHAVQSFDITYAIISSLSKKLKFTFEVN